MTVHISEEHREITIPQSRRKNLDQRERERETDRRKKQNTKTLFKNSFNFLVAGNVTLGFTNL